MGSLLVMIVFLYQNVRAGEDNRIMQSECATVFEATGCAVISINHNITITHPRAHPEQDSMTPVRRSAAAADATSSALRAKKKNARPFIVTSRCCMLLQMKTVL